MRRTAAALVFAVAVSVAHGAASELQSASRSKPAVSLGTHAVRGIVKTVDAGSMVIARSSQRSSEMTFVLRPSTEREGTITAGATVSVRYVTEDHALVATAVFVQADHPRPPTKVGRLSRRVADRRE